MAETEDIQKAIGAGSLGFGVLATLAPGAFLGLYGVPAEEKLRTMTRMWGTRTTVLGALTFALGGDDDRRTLMTLAAAMNAADAVIVASSGGLPARARILGSLTSAGFAGAIAYALNT